ncbi:MAG: S41 family peptidase, partial [Ruminiclostridium sp.]|nr:S41 family peptidase [Ruminiclostridium sp.]
LFKGNLYLLTSTSTFSSAMCFAQYIKDNSIGTIIGEPSGNAPDSYGDITAFKLPNSGAAIQMSTKKWYRIDNIEGLIEPDIPCEEWEALDYFYKECE